MYAKWNIVANKWNTVSHQTVSVCIAEILQLKKKGKK